MSAARLCVIGSSHVACLKLAETGGAPTGLPATEYFAASGNLIAELHLTDGRYLAAAAGGAVAPQLAAVSAGKTRIDLADYDAFALVGVCFQFRDILRLFRSHCLWRHRDWRGARALIGDAGFAEFLRGVYRFRPAYRFARDIAAVRPDAPVLLLPSPFPTAAVLEEQGMRDLRDLRDTSYFAEIVRLHRDAATAAARSVGARVLFQRDEAVAAPGFTAPRFNEAAVGLRAADKTSPGQWHEEKRAADPWHMNRAFGRMRLEDIRAALAA